MQVYTQRESAAMASTKTVVDPTFTTLFLFPIGGLTSKTIHLDPLALYLCDLSHAAANPIY
jgi:hypothetical protein